MKKLAKLFLLVGLIISSSSVQATIVVKNDYRKGFIKSKITLVAIEDLDTFSLISENGREFELVCARNPMYGNRKPLVRFKNYYNINTPDFEIVDNNFCIELAEYLTMVFEGINDENPLYLEFDKKNHIVSKIIYPNLDPYKYYDQDVIKPKQGGKRVRKGLAVVYDASGVK